MRAAPQENGEGGRLFCAWVSRWVHCRDVALRDPGRLAVKREFYTKHTKDGCVFVFGLFFGFGL